MEIRIRMKYHGMWLVIILAALLLSVFVIGTVVFFDEGSVGLAVLTIVLSLVIVFSLWLGLSYGIYINEKRVVLIDQSEVRIIPYENISKITVRFTDDSITAIVKEKRQGEHVFVWNHLYFGHRIILPSKLDLMINDKLISEIASRLITCPKVEVQNFYNCDKPKKRRT